MAGISGCSLRTQPELDVISHLLTVVFACWRKDVCVSSIELVVMSDTWPAAPWAEEAKPPANTLDRGHFIDVHVSQALDTWRGAVGYDGGTKCSCVDGLPACHQRLVVDHYSSSHSSPRNTDGHLLPLPPFIIRGFLQCLPIKLACLKV